MSLTDDESVRRQKLGRYEIRSQLGAGGMGEVYLAHDTQLRRPVALKLHRHHRPIASRLPRMRVSSRALDLFVSLFGAEAGNLALRVKATNGVFLGGGIAPGIIERLKGPAFMEAFTAKGPMSCLLEAVPVRVILNVMTALLGAAICASSAQ